MTAAFVSVAGVAHADLTDCVHQAYDRVLTYDPVYELNSQTCKLFLERIVQDHVNDGDLEAAQLLKTSAAKQGVLLTTAIPAPKKPKSGCQPGAAFCLSVGTIQTGEVKVAKNDLCGISENSPDFQPDLVEPPFEVTTDAHALALVALLNERCGN